MNLKPVQEFLTGKRPVDWLQLGHLSVYVRKGYHLIGSECYQTFDIANLDTPERYQSKGTFKTFMTAVEPVVASSGIKVLYVENVLNERLIPFLERIGYTFVPRSDPPCYYKVIL